MFGASLSFEFPDAKDRPTGWDALARYDGGHYAEIVNQGYSYNPIVRSTVAFFPAYPLVGRLVMSATDRKSVV